MSANPAAIPAGDAYEESMALVRQLHGIQARLQELAGGEIDAVLLPGGQSYLLQQAQDKLRESEERFRGMFTAAATGIAISTPHGQFLQVNPAYCRMLGYTEAELLQRNFASLTHPDDLTLNLQLRDEPLAGRRDNFVMEKRYLKKDGAIVWTRHSVSASRTVRGEITKLIVVVEDITERKRAEENLVKKQAESQLLFDLMPAMLCFKDTENRFLRVNQRLAEAAGRPIAEIEGASAAEIFPQEADKYFADDLEVIRSRTAKLGIIEKLHSLDGQALWVQTDKVPVCQPDGEVTGVVVLVQDITERKRAEESLVLFRTLIDQSSDSIEVVDPATYRYLDINESACVHHGYTRQEMLSLSVGDIDPNFGPALRERVDKGLQANGRMIFESRHRRKDGTLFPVEVTLNLVQLDRSYLVAMARDTTERKRTESRFRRLLDSNVQGVFFWNVNGEVTGGNDAFLNLVGYSREDLEAGRIRWDAMTPPEYRHLDQVALRQIAETGVCASYEKEWMCQNGSRVPILLGAANFEDAPQDGVCFVVDLTERKRIERQFLRAQRMESIGTLAGGIAHDLNNSLTPVIMSLDILAMKFPDPDSQHLLEVLGDSARRGANMVRQILSFARGVEGERKEMQIKYLVSDVESIARDTFPKDVVFSTAVPTDLWAVLGDATQLHQVLLNLCVNARDAMPQGGRLLITGENLTLDAQYAGLNPDAKAGPYVAIKVEDTGTGISPADIHKIFDPFYTTKEVGKGTGLGLSTTTAIVRGHGGFLRVYSELGKGTQFIVFLPALTDAAAAAAENTPTVELPFGQNELILVVDDEPAVRTITQLTLEAYGYRAIFANDGAEAIMLFVSRKSEIAAVVTDMMMPLMDGPALIQILLRMNPLLQIIAASGLSANAHVAKAASLGVRHFLSKPYTAQALLNALKELLEDKRAVPGPVPRGATLAAVP